jgi:hypothetical protein
METLLLLHEFKVLRPAGELIYTQLSGAWTCTMPYDFSALFDEGEEAGYLVNDIQVVGKGQRKQLAKNEAVMQVLLWAWRIAKEPEVVKAVVERRKMVEGKDEEEVEKVEMEVQKVKNAEEGRGRQREGILIDI